MPTARSTISRSRSAATSGTTWRCSPGSIRPTCSPRGWRRTSRKAAGSTSRSQRTQRLARPNHDGPLGHPHCGPPRRNRLHGGAELPTDRKSTRLNSSHITISYAVFCLKKKKQKRTTKNITDTEKTQSLYKKQYNHYKKPPNLSRGQLYKRKRNKENND